MYITVCNAQLPGEITSVCVCVGGGGGGERRGRFGRAGNRQTRRDINMG